MKVIISNRLIISDPTIAVKAYCEKYLKVDNPDFYKLEKMGKWTGNTPRILYLYEVVDNELWLPFGCLQDIWNLHQCAEDFIPGINAIHPRDYVSNIKLYPYQEKAVMAALKSRNGILVMPCGSGKTQCGLEIIARIGGRALWLTHTQDLLNQSKKRAETVLSCGGLGTITAGKVNIGTHITFATVQTLSKLDLRKYQNQWDVIIVDECQHCAGSPTKVTQFYKVMSNLSARYKIGLTATPKRADGLHVAMFALLGNVFYEVSREEVAHTTCPVKVNVIETGWTPDYDAVLMGDGTIDYNKIIDNMTHDEDRYNLVFLNVTMVEGATMVLAKRVEYLQRMCDDYVKNYHGAAVCLSGQGQSKRAKQDRKEALEKLNTGELDCIFATYQLAKEGLDVPNLRNVIFATPEQDETTVIQAVGRVGRKADGKKYGVVYDFVDNFGMYRGYLKKRMRYYKKIEADVLT